MGDHCAPNLAGTANCDECDREDAEYEGVPNAALPVGGTVCRLADCAKIFSHLIAIQISEFHTAVKDLERNPALFCLPLCLLKNFGLSGSSRRQIQMD